MNLTLRSMVKVVSESWMYSTHPLIVIDPCAKYCKPMSNKKKVMWMLNKTRGPLATSLTWKTSSNQLLTYDYIISLIRRGKYPFLCENWMVIVLHLTKLKSPSPKDASCQVWLKSAQWFWRRRFNYQFGQCIFAIS